MSMEKEGILTLAQLFSTMKDSVDVLERAIKSKDNEKVVLAKKEIIKIQKEIEGML